MKKLFYLSLILLIFTSINAFSVWQKNCVPGQYLGRDPSNGGIICAGQTPPECFCVYTPGPAPDGPKCVFVPIANWGLTNINGISTISNPSGTQTESIPIITSNTQEVNNENDIIDWMNTHYGNNQ